MTDYGVTDTGFVKKPLSAILQDIQDRHRASFGAGIDVAIARELGQVDGNVASEMAEVWEILEIVDHSYDPEAAEGVQLENLASLTGTIKQAARASTALISVNLNAGITLVAGTLIAFLGRPDIQFTLDAQVVNSGGSAADVAIDVDGKPLRATCTQTGAIVAPAGALTVKVSVVSGWNSVTNTADAVPGRDADTEIQLRQARENELALRGGSTAKAMKADLLDVKNHPELTGIRSVDVLSNRTDAIDANGLPPHSFEIVIDDGDTPSVDDDAIAQAIFDTGPEGINTAGATSAVAVDEDGDAQPISFSRAVLRPVYATYTLSVTDKYPAGGADLVKAAVLNLALSVQTGQAVIALAFRAVALTVPGVYDVTDFKIGFSPSPALANNLAPGVRERATFNSVNIVVSP